MSTSHSAPNSQSIPDVCSEPSSTPEQQSAPTATGTNSNSSPEPHVIEINNDIDDAKVEVTTVSKKMKSEAWLHFDRVIIDSKVKAVCKYCKAKLVGDSSSGTSHLHTHIKTKHHNLGQKNIRQKLLASNFNKAHPELASYNFSHDGAKAELAKMIIMHEYPISIVEHIGFRRYSSYLQPLFKVPCRKTIKKEIFQIYEFEKAKTISLLESNISRVAITSDMWTASNQKKGYMAITAHYINDSWQLKSIIMRFIYVPCPHTKDVLCDQIFTCLMDWNLDRKISCLTLDNCSTNDAMVELLLEKLDSSKLIAGGCLFHMRCAAHILNLIVKDGLDVNALQSGC